MMIRMRFFIHPIKEEAIPNAGDTRETKEDTDSHIMKTVTGEEPKEDNMMAEKIPMQIGIIDIRGRGNLIKVMAEMTGMSSEEEVITSPVDRLTYRHDGISLLKSLFSHFIVFGLHSNTSDI